jgi:hypothetical protein
MVDDGKSGGKIQKNAEPVLYGITRLNEGIIYTHLPVYNVLTGD